MARLASLVREHKALVLLFCAVLLLCLVPSVRTALVVGEAWAQVPPVYMDEYVYYSHITEAGSGNVLFGNPYLLEHRNQLPLVLFGSTVLAALPLLLGVSLVPALLFNFILWSLVFAGLYYRLMREFALPTWLSAAGSLFAFIQSYDQVYRVSVRQEVFPFLFLFWIALVRFIKVATVRNALWLGAAAGVSFYIYGFLWQTVVVTLGLLALYALVVKNWNLFKHTLLASLIGGMVGAPAFAYTVWITGHEYFAQSANRFGLVLTHLPVAEVVYSGTWAGVAVACMLLVWWRVPILREQKAFGVAVLFVAVTGLALWIMQGSNILTGILWETGDHMRRFIIVWLPLATLLVGYAAYCYREHLAPLVRYTTVVALVLLGAANIYFGYHHSILVNAKVDMQIWKDQQTYMAPLRWLDENEKEPVVVWGDPDNFSTIHVPVLTRHYVLFTEATQFMLMQSSEVRERYLVSQYFKGVTVDSLKNNLLPHAGRANAYHLPKTIERQVKVCAILKFWSKESCGTAPTAEELLGEAYFTELEQKFTNNIKPNIGEYLHKYHVSYILKDIAKDPEIKPESLGAERVYQDDYFELYKLQ